MHDEHIISTYIFYWHHYDAYDGAFFFLALAWLRRWFSAYLEVYKSFISRLSLLSFCFLLAILSDMAHFTSLSFERKRATNNPWTKKSFLLSTWVVGQRIVRYSIFSFLLSFFLSCPSLFLFSPCPPLVFLKSDRREERYYFVKWWRRASTVLSLYGISQPPPTFVELRG